MELKAEGKKGLGVGVGKGDLRRSSSLTSPEVGRDLGERERGRRREGGSTKRRGL